MKQELINKQAYSIKIDNFEGPMELLLFLISKHKMDIFDICLSDLTDKYVEYLNEMTEENIEIASEFIVMAATLLDIKAKKLLPELSDEDEKDEDGLTEQDIITRLIEYKKYKEISDTIKEMYAKNFGSFSNKLPSSPFTVAKSGASKNISNIKNNISIASNCFLKSKSLILYLFILSFIILSYHLHYLRYFLFVLLFLLFLLLFLFHL